MNHAKVVLFIFLSVCYTYQVSQMISVRCSLDACLPCFSVMRFHQDYKPNPTEPNVVSAALVFRIELHSNCFLHVQVYRSEDRFEFHDNVEIAANLGLLRHARSKSLLESSRDRDVALFQDYRRYPTTIDLSTKGHGTLKYPAISTCITNWIDRTKFEARFPDVRLYVFLSYTLSFCLYLLRSRSHSLYPPLASCLSLCFILFR